ncbi:type II toxin-antitoxin system death-on-curing family toxin [Nocardia salmonicida]|uniref:type II toxin-antitoxin system death-on-curing family toxin n=1 Tax=Nocardia salmonicida TaxID=53431 RepID=UPI0034176637
MSVDYLTVDTVIAINKQFGGDGAGVVDRAGLEGALGRPQSGGYDGEYFQGLWLKAAVLLQSLASTQYFSDGNKRTAWLSALTFLELNGEEIRYVPAIEAEPFVLALAVTAYSHEQAAEWLQYQRISETRLTSAMLCGRSFVQDGTLSITGGGITYLYATELPGPASFSVALVFSSDFNVRDSVVVNAEVHGPTAESTQFVGGEDGSERYDTISHMAYLEKAGPAVPGEPWQLNLSLPYTIWAQSTGRHHLRLTFATDHDGAHKTVLSMPFAVTESAMLSSDDDALAVHARGAEPCTAATWITREKVTMKHLRGLLQGLTSHGEVLDYTQVRIMAVPNDLSAGVTLPGEMFGRDEDLVVNDENLPPEGILLFASGEDR